MTYPGRPFTGQKIVIITGPAGAGRGTAIGGLEDLGYEAIDNLPLSFVPRLVSGPPPERPLTIGIDPRNRDFSVDRLLDSLDEIEAATGQAPVLAYLHCDADVLLRRYGETRRRHPLSPLESALVGIEREITLLAPLKRRADVLIDTTDFSPHELRAEVARHFGLDGETGALAITLQSFSYKRGIPLGADMVIDVRFLRNPHWEPDLRVHDGRDPVISDFVRSDPAFGPFYDRLVDLLRFLLPKYREEGKSYFGLALGCSGGKHRSVVTVELLAKTLAEEGWQVSSLHRDLQRAAETTTAGQPRVGVA